MRIAPRPDWLHLTDPAEIAKRRARFYAGRRDRLALHARHRVWTHPRSQREWRFCAAIARGLVYLMGAGIKLDKDQLGKLAAGALDDAGYRAARTKKGLQLLDLPRVQQGVADILNEKGVNIALAGRVLKRVMSDQQDNDAALKATELFFKVTTGFAVQKSAQLHARTDKFFDEPTFANPGKPVISTSQEP